MVPYEEQKQSRTLYRLNQEFLIRKFAPYLSNYSRVDKIFRYIYLFIFFVKDIVNHKRVDIRRAPEFYEKNIMMDDNVKKIAVYTCVFGEYDDIKDPLYVSDKCDYYIITDQKVSQNSIWEKIDIESIDELFNIKEANMKNRWVKMHPHKIFKEYEISIYIDASILAVCDLYPLSLMLKKDSFLGIHLHPYREKIETEMAEIIACGKTRNPEGIKKQIEVYREAGYNNQLPLFEATVLVRRHNSKQCVKVMEEWWSHINLYEPRDQISLPFVLWKNNVALKNISILGTNVRLNPRFIWFPHNEQSN